MQSIVWKIYWAPDLNIGFLIPMLSSTGVFEEICDRKFSCRCPLQLLLFSEYTHKQHSVAFHNNCIYNIFIGCLICIETFQLNKGILQMQANNLYEQLSAPFQTLWYVNFYIMRSRDKFPP